MSKSMEKIEKKLEILTQNAVIEKGAQPLLELGYVKGIRSLMKKARKALAASDRWQKVGPGAFCHNGNTRLALCAMLGPIYAIYFDGFSTRMRTYIIQRDNLDTAYCYAVDIRKGIAPLCNALYLTSAEGKALEDMLSTGSDLFGDIEHCLKWNSRDILPTKKAAKACSLSFSEEQLLDALEAVGQTGRELILTGLLNQLSVYFCPEDRPCLLVNIVNGASEIAFIKAILGAVNFSTGAGSNGTEPMSHTISSGGVSQLHGELSLYTSGPGLKEFFTALEECQRTERWLSEIACPFPSIPILMTPNVIWNGGVWNIEIDGSSLPEADDRTLDCLRAAAREILHKPKLPQYDLLPAIDASRNSTAAYRTRLVHRWRTALTQMLLHRWFSAKQYEQARQLFLNDAEKIKQQERARTTQLNLAVKTVFSPAAYADGRVVLCPKQKESALEALQTAYALFYVPGTSAKAKGPFLCFSNASLQRLLENHGIPGNLLEEIIRQIKCGKNRTETIPFQKGQQERFIKMDISGCPELLSKLQSLQSQYAQ